MLQGNLKGKSIQNSIKYLQKADILYQPEIQMLIFRFSFMNGKNCTKWEDCRQESTGFLNLGKPSQEYFKCYPFALCISIKDVFPY